MYAFKENINVNKNDSKRKESDQIWEDELKPLIDKRNDILDAHDNSFESFELQEIILIDREMDRVEEKLHAAIKKENLIRFPDEIKRNLRNGK